MGERKVLNKYYPPDFETFKLPKLRRTNQQYVVRLMIPFTMRCLTCGNHVYKGKKFNARKETVDGEKYLGMPIFRFYIRCPVCLSEIAFKTDPENTDYAAEAGAYRTFQAENIARKEEERKQQEKEEDEANNPMLALENRTKESRREMDILDVLEEIRDLNAQQEGVTFQQLMDRHLEREKKEAEDEEQIIDALAKAAYQNESRKIKRVKDDDNDDLMTSQKKLREEEKDEKKPKSKTKMMNLVKRKDQSKLNLQAPPTESHPPADSQLQVPPTKSHPPTDSQLQVPPTELNPPTDSHSSLSQAPPTEPHPPTSQPSTSLGLLSTYSDEDSDSN